MEHQELVAAHGELIGARLSAATAGVKASLTRRIAGVEAELRRRGIDFQPADLSRPTSRSVPEDASDEGLLAARQKWIAARKSAATRGERQGASRRIRTIEAALRERGVQFDPAQLGRPTRRAAPLPSNTRSWWRLMAS